MKVDNPATPEAVYEIGLTYPTHCCYRVQIIERIKMRGKSVGKTHSIINPVHFKQYFGDII